MSKPAARPNKPKSTDVIVQVILRRSRGEAEAQWKETTEAECIRHTEESGYWKSGTVLAMLAEGLTVSTPWADYKAKGESINA